MKPLLVLGIMSGTSMGSTDYALCRVEKRRIRLAAHWQVRYPAPLEIRLQAAAHGTATSHELAQLHHDLGRFYARGAALAPTRPQLAGLHGQTIFHHPHHGSPATLQIGESTYLARRLGVPVIHNFRAGDLAAGGQGAPLASLFHQLVFGKRGRHRCVNNLGGISNLTSIDWKKRGGPEMLAFDTGPANLLIDLAMRQLSHDRLRFDLNGAWATGGKVIDSLVQKWLSHSFFRQPPPKSTGRELFGELFLERLLRDLRPFKPSRFDTVATLTRFTARSIALNYRLHLPSPPESVYLSGGGARNPALVREIGLALRRWSPEIEITPVTKSGWTSETIEAGAFALLAYYRWNRIPANLPQTTGAKEKVLLGQVTEV